MQTVIFGVGCGVALLLIALLMATILNPDLKLWPTPGEKTWQSYVFWPLFRGLNALCVLSAALSAPAFHLGIPLAVRGLALVVLAASVAIFVYAFKLLGRDNSYGAQDGLVTGGIYRFTRNPQNAMLIVVYAALAVASDHLPTMMLCLSMIAVYALMVFAEEHWLSGVYGEAYERYCREVPRFFGVARAFDWLRGRSV
jgi:protein-S-isoprenylcysteine O-methyltransferase Ste14